LTITSTTATAIAHVQMGLIARTRTRPRFTKSMMPWVWRTGMTLTADGQNMALEGIQKELERAIGCRYTQSTAVMALGEITNTSFAASRQVIIKPPLAVDIVGVDFHAAGTTGTYTLSATGVTGWSNLSLTTDSTTVHKATSSNWVGRIPAGQEVIFTVSGVGAFTLQDCYFVLHFRHDRHAAAPPATFDKPDLDSGDSRDPTQLSAAYSQYNADVTTDGNNTSRLVIHQMRNTGDNKMRIPATARSWQTVDYCISAAVGRSVDPGIFDKGAVDRAGVAALAGNGGASPGTTTQGTSVTNDPQVDDDPDDTADDWYFSNTLSGAGSVEKIYCVLYGIASS
jgi:hypothetical protein